MLGSTLQTGRDEDMPEIIPVPTAPIGGTSEVQRAAKSGTVTSGRAKLKYGPRLTGWLAFDATATQMRDALRALNAIGASGVNATGGPISTTPVDFTFAGAMAGANVQQIQLGVSELVGGGTWLLTTTTPGVDATARGMPPGTVVVAQDTGLLYVNVGTANAPVWKRLLAGASNALVDLVHAVGTADGTLDDVGGTFNQATLNNNLKELSSRVNALAAVLRNGGAIP